MKYFVFFLVCFSLLSLNLMAEKRTFKKDLTYQKNIFDTNETTTIVATLFLTDALENDILKFIEKRNELKSFSFVTIELKSLIHIYCEPKITLGKSSGTTYSVTALVVFDTDDFLQFFLKTRNSPDTFNFYTKSMKDFLDNIKNLESITKKITPLKTSDTSSNETTKDDYFKIVQATQDADTSLSIIAQYIKTNYDNVIKRMNAASSDVQSRQRLLYFKGIACAVKKKKDDVEEIMLELQKNTAANPTNVLFSLLINAKIAEVNLNFHEAVSYYNEALSKFPDFSEPLYERIQLHMRQNSTQEALKDIELFLKNNPHSGDILYTQGTIFFNIKKEKDAVSVITKAAKIGHQQSLLWIKRYNANKQLQTEKQAERD